MPADKTITILGGGVGGLVTARELRGRLGREHRIVLVDREARHVFSPSFLWLMVGRRRPEKIWRDLSRVSRKGIEVVRGAVTAIDPESRRVEVAGRTIESDYLVVSLGADLEPDRIPGLAAAGHNLYTLEGATEIRDTRLGLDHGRLVVLVSSMPFKCPAAPYEAAMLLDDDLRKRGVRDNVEMTVFSPEPGPMGVAGPEMSGAVRQMIEDRGIEYRPQHQVESVDPDARTLRFNDGSEEPFDYLVYIPPHAAPQVVRDSGLAGETGWVSVDRHTMETGFEGVYAIGDVTTIPLAMGLPLPKAGTFALRQARAVAQTIAAEVRETGTSGRFDGFGECFVEVGGGKAGMGSGNFYAEPTPEVKLRKPGRIWHIGKVLFEKRWFNRWA
ncbi:MAG: FAD/NAD(P)-binding oxidoreductase [Chloroflexi bacterium]|nr:FAD/NAD(P)-binding oxidoreductase [Chloroflexota bacterium]